ncbi:hypothetical protein ACFXPS_19355 [Nocardia sp. NPDC059091]
MDTVSDWEPSGQWALQHAEEISAARTEFDERAAREPEPIRP